VAQKFHFAILRIVTRASRGLSAIAELLVHNTSRALIGLRNTVNKCKMLF